MAYFLKKGNTYRITPKEALNFTDKLPVATYTISQDCSGSFYLETIDSFEHKQGKLYGNTVRNADRILRTFQDRQKATGVLLSGAKGSGKTLLAKYVSMQAAEQGIPTIVINNNWYGEAFNTFLQMIDQPTVVLFDEFEKVYKEMEHQERVLTLLDGVYPSKKLFLLTCNNKWGINVNMRNRPGRIYYMLEFSGLEEDFIREYCQDNLHAKDNIEKLCAISALFSTFNFDMLKGMVEEMNRYDETPSEVLRFLNARPDFENDEVFVVQLTVGNVEMCHKKHNINKEWHGNPIKEGVHLQYMKEGEKSYDDAEFTSRHLERLDSRKGSYTFVNGDARLVLTRRPKVTLDLETFCESRKFGGATEEKLGLSQKAGQLTDASMMIDADGGDY